MRSLLLLSLLAACASPVPDRDVDSGRRGLEAVRQRRAFLSMADEDVARSAMPGYHGRGVPNLARVAALMPQTWTAEMEAWNALRREGTLDRRLLHEVFYYVSSANDCFY